MTSPYILCIDTTRDYCSVLLSAGGYFAGIRQSPVAIDHSKSISLLTRHLLNELMVTRNDLAAIAVNLGPGSYTSLRTGLSFSLGFRLALGLPLIGYNTLEVLGHLGNLSLPPSQHMLAAVALQGGAFYAGEIVSPGFALIAGGHYFPSYSQMAEELNAFSETLEVVKYPEKITISRNQGSLSKSIHSLDESTCALVHQRLSYGESGSNVWQPLYIRPPFITQPKKIVKGQQI